MQKCKEEDMHFNNLNMPLPQNTDRQHIISNYRIAANSLMWFHVCELCENVDIYTQISRLAVNLFEHYAKMFCLHPYA